MSDRSSLHIALFAAPGCGLALVRELRVVGTVSRVTHSAELMTAVNAGVRLLLIDVGNFLALTSIAREHLRKFRGAGLLKVVLLIEHESRSLAGSFSEIDLELQVSATMATSAAAIHEFLKSHGLIKESSSSSKTSLRRHSLFVPKKVVIVDDSDLMNRITTAILSEAGYQVLCITKPFDMRRTILAHMPDLVLVDYNMPALRGDHLIEINQRSGICVPMVLYSNASDDVLAAAAHRCGAVGYVRKSASPALLIARITAWLHEPVAPASSADELLPVSRRSDPSLRTRRTEE